MDQEQTDYLKYRGKCKELSEAACAADPSLRLVRGHYYDPIWGEQAHWWAVRDNGEIVDPTKDQFPSKGSGAYIEFSGFVNCEECGKEIHETEARFDGNGRYAFCSDQCNASFCGIF